MPSMDRSLFEGEDCIDIEDLKKAEVENCEEAVGEALRRFNWTGQATGCVILQLAPDNCSVASGQFATRGRITKDDYKWEASKIWSAAETGLLLTLQVPDASAFTFCEGGLCSDLLDMANVEHCITSTGRGASLLLQANYKEKGIGAFCLRLVCHIARASTRNGIVLGYTVLLFPGTSEEVLAVSEWAKSPSWPGLKVTEGEMLLLPTPSSPWKCPILPLLQTGTPWGMDTAIPALDELRGKVAAIMATSEPAESCKTRKALMSKWEKFANCPDEFTPRRSPLTWPKPPSTRNQGRKCDTDPKPVPVWPRQDSPPPPWSCRGRGGADGYPTDP